MSFLLYRKFLKTSEIVYNNIEIKMSMTKERREHFAMTLIMRFLFFGLTALSDYRERIVASMDLSISKSLSILFK